MQARVSFEEARVFFEEALLSSSTAEEGDGGSVSTAAVVGTAAAEAGGLQPWQQRRQFATMEAAEGGGGSSVDVHGGLIMCGSDFPLLPVQACGRNSTKADSPAGGGRNPPPQKNQLYWKL